MHYTVRIIPLLILLTAPSITIAAEDSKISKRFRAVQPVAVTTRGTWAILHVDGASREVDPYLSSLARGEVGTGTVSSPAFAVSGESITFTVCGHDGQGGGRGRNYVALVDDKTSETLRKTPAPGNDVLQTRSWKVADLQGRKVRIELHDGLAENAFAWMGVGKIEADGALQVDFEHGMPGAWQATTGQAEIRTGLVSGGIPFRQLRSAYTMIGEQGETEIPCGFRARRLFLLGCTVSAGQPLEVCGWVEIVYEQGPSERVPLMIGYTLDRQAKLLSPSPAMRLHPSGDPYQYYLVLRPRPEKISTLRLRSNVGAVPRITAITCELLDFEADANLQSLLPLPETHLSEAEEAWIDAHAVAANAPDLLDIEVEIRRANKISAVSFQRNKISDRAFEAASVCDLNNDGVADIVSGGFWYEGPGFTSSHKIRDVRLAGEYLDDFSDYPLDVNGDGALDIVTGAYFGNPLQWLENPKEKTGPWTVHDISQVGPIETVRCWDVDGDGVVEVVPNAGGNVVFFRLVRNAQGKGTGKFTKHVVKKGGCGHGLGFGDINGDGRGDFVVPDGWLEGPADPLTGAWIWHDDGLHLGTASVPILVHDVNEDGQADLIVGQAHSYGLDWYEQAVAEDGKRTWTRHPIDRYGSQYHDMQLADIDNDGQPELITGKRYRAHNGHDPGSSDPLFVRYYELELGAFACRNIDFGSHEQHSGVGIYFWVTDIDGDGWQDIVAPGKEGLYLFKSRGIR